MIDNILVATDKVSLEFHLKQMSHMQEKLNLRNDLLMRAAELLEAAYENVGISAWEEKCVKWLKGCGSMTTKVWEVSDDQLKRYEKAERLVERAAELLRSCHVEDDDDEPLWKQQRDQWLKNAGVEK